MLPKKQRVTKKTDFERLIKSGKYFSTNNFSVRYLYTINSDNSKNSLKLAISVGLKISKKANERNRLRRRVAAAVAGALKEKISSVMDKSVNILLVPKKSSEILETAELSEEIKSIINIILKNG
jgi:ribonuclease P protein component